MGLSLICGMQYYQLKVSNVFSFMESEVFIGIVGDEDVDCCVKVQDMMVYGWCMILRQFLDNSDSPSIVDQ